jgi:hypothetical protein
MLEQCSNHYTLQYLLIKYQISLRDCSLACGQLASGGEILVKTLENSLLLSQISRFGSKIKVEGCIKEQ